MSKVRKMFNQAMKEELPSDSGLEPLFTEAAVEKAISQIEGLGTMSRKQLRSLIALHETRFHWLMSQLAVASSGVDIAQAQGRLRECTGLMAFYRHMLRAKEEGEE